MECATLFIVIPCYNEEAVLPLTAPLFLENLQKMIRSGLVSDESRILFVDDGSRDATWELIRRFAKQDRHMAGIRQSRNRGHQNAVLAGLMEARDRCDITISIDCDGQDDMAAMTEMVQAYYDGCDVVYGVRNSRDTDTFFKRFSAECFYRLLNWLGVECVYNHADYRLLSKRALAALAQFKEVNLFLRGMVPLVGFKSTSVYYRRSERRSGSSHYPLSKMISLALDGITSLSIRPIRLISGMGFTVSTLSFCGIMYSLVSWILGRAISGWTSTVCILCFISGVQLLSLGMIGEYVGKIYLETKERPRYIISDRTWEEETHAKKTPSAKEMEN